MVIIVDDDNIITGWAVGGNYPDGKLIPDNNVPPNFKEDFDTGKYIYQSGEIKDNPDYVPPVPPGPSLQDQIDELKSQNETLQEQNQMLTDCLLEMSEIVYGGS